MTSKTNRDARPVVQPQLNGGRAKGRGLALASIIHYARIAWVDECEEIFGSLSTSDRIMWYIIVAQDASSRVVAQTNVFYMVMYMYFVRCVLGRFEDWDGWAANGLKRLDEGGDLRPQLFLHDCNVQTSEMEPGISIL